MMSDRQLKSSIDHFRDDESVSYLRCAMNIGSAHSEASATRLLLGITALVRRLS